MIVIDRGRKADRDLTQFEGAGIQEGATERQRATTPSCQDMQSEAGAIGNTNQGSHAELRR